MADQKVTNYKEYTKEKGCISSIPSLYYIFYRTDNLENGKYYYGVHATNNVQDNYLGSGKTLKKAIQKYGKEKFKRQDLKFFNSMLEAYEYEAQVVTRDLVADRMCYNEKPGGLGGMKGMITVHKNGQYWKVRVEDLEDILESDPDIERGGKLQGRPSKLKGRKQSVEHIRRRSEALKGRTGQKGIPKPDGFGEKIRQIRLGKVGNTKDRVSVWKDRVRLLVQKNDLSKYEKDGWIRTDQYRCIFNKKSGDFYIVNRKDVQRYLTQGFIKSRYADLRDTGIGFRLI